MYYLKCNVNQTIATLGLAPGGDPGKAVAGLRQEGSSAGAVETCEYMLGW